MARMITKKKKPGQQEEEKRDKLIFQLIALLIVIVLIMAVMVIQPLIQRQRQKAETYACSLAMKKAEDVLLVEFLSDPELSQSQAAVIVDKSKLAMDTLCPGGGDFYLVPSGGTWHVTCGVHEGNSYIRTRLNATHVLDLLNAEIAERRRLEVPFDDQVLTWEINGKPLAVTRLEGDNGLRRGTDYSIDFDGVVCFYSLNPGGDVHWFVYADADHAAVWKEETGWSGDAYSMK